MKNLFIVFSFLISVTLFVSGCSDDFNIKEELAGENIKKDSEYLKFASEDDFKSFLENINEDNTETSLRSSKNKAIIYKPIGFKSIAERKRETKTNQLRSDSEDEIEEMTEDEYNLMRAENLLLDPILTEVMDTTLRIGIAQNLYKITKYGTFISPISKESELNKTINNFETIFQNSSIIESDSIVDITNGIKYINSFKYSSIINNEVKDSGEMEISSTLRSSSNDYISKYGLASYKWESKTWLAKVWSSLFGKDISKENKFTNTRRVQVNLFQINYGFYASSGVKVGMQKQKKFLFVKYWVSTNASKMVIGFDRLDGIMTFNQPPSHIDPLGSIAYNSFAGTFNGIPGALIYKGYHGIGFLKDWSDKILSFVPTITVFGTTYPTTEQKKKFYDTPATQIYSQLKALTGKYIFNPIKREIVPEDPRIAYMLWGNTDVEMKSYLQGVKEYTNVESKTIRFDQSFGFSYYNGFVTSFLPTQFKIKAVDMFGAVYDSNTWKGIRFYDNL